MIEPSGERDGMIVRVHQPYNAETALIPLRQSLITPLDLFYIRSHGNIPRVDPGRYRLEVSGLVKRPLMLSLQELRNNYPRNTVTAVVQCAGNRRDELMEVTPIPEEIPWGAGAIGNAQWTGVPLREVLLAAESSAEVRHAAFLGLDDVDDEDGSFKYGSSIPIEKAMSPEVLLAYEMNGEPLRSEHGAPLRVVTPDYIGARSVKWLSSITLQAEPSDNPFQTREYKLFPSNVTAQTADYSEGLMLGEAPTNAVICEPADGISLAAGPVLVRGYALAGGGRRVKRVDLSVDEGCSWSQAKLSENEDQRWARRFWETSLNLAPGAHQIVVRTFDSAANTQPEDAGTVWNFKGYANNAWHKIKVNAR